MSATLVAPHWRPTHMELLNLLCANDCCSSASQATWVCSMFQVALTLPRVRVPVRVPVRVRVRVRVRMCMSMCMERNTFTAANTFSFWGLACWKVACSRSTRETPKGETHAFLNARATARAAQHLLLPPTEILTDWVPRARARTQTHANTPTHTHRHMHTHTHTPKHTHKHAHVHKRTHRRHRRAHPFLKPLLGNIC